MSKEKEGSVKNLIFQYMILNPDLDEQRGPILGQSRSKIYSECADISRKSFEIYADKIGADYLYSDQAVYTKDEYERDATVCLFECLRLIYDPIFDEYDNVFFADTDIVVNTDESIFDIHEGDVTGILESDIRTASGGGYNGWDYKESTYNDQVRKFEHHGIPITPAMPPNRPSKIQIMNTGVVVWSKQARLRARKVFDNWKEWYFEGPQMHMSLMNDQPYLSGQFVKHDFDLNLILDQTWNDSPHYETEEEFFEKAKMCHYTGGEWKVDMIRHYQEKKFKIFE